MTNYRITDFDIVFLSYDEPNAEKNYAWLKRHVSTAKRVHGVKGFDSAHRAVGNLATTHRVLTIDGDNYIDPEFFNQEIEIDDVAQKDYVFSWAGRNSVNGLCYGNGGLKLWPTHTIKQMDSHEHSSSDSSKVDFCWDVTYQQMIGTWCETVVNETPFQAFRAGFREGVKMSLDQGERPARRDFKDLGIHNRHRLAIWCSVGFDVRNGDWAILGARLGFHRTMVELWDFNAIADYDWFNSYWDEIYDQYKTKKTRHKHIKFLGEMLRKEMHFDMTELDADASRFFRSLWTNPIRTGLMNPE